MNFSLLLYLSICVPLCLYLCLCTFQHVYLCLCNFVSVSLFVYLSTCVSLFVYLSICVPLCLYLCLCTFLHVYLCMCSSICELSMYLWRGMGGGGLISYETKVRSIAKNIWLEQVLKLNVFHWHFHEWIIPRFKSYMIQKWLTLFDTTNFIPLKILIWWNLVHLFIWIFYPQNGILYSNNDIWTIQKCVKNKRLFDQI